jgi:hypothetical protein
MDPVYAASQIFAAPRIGGAIMAAMPEKYIPVLRPQPSEYAAYYEKYVALVPGADVMAALETQQMLTTQLLAARSEREGNFRYAPDKWTLKEVIGHVVDAERVFSYRALRIGRGDATPLSSFEQDSYVANGNFNERALADLADEYDHVRNATLSLYQGFTGEAWGRRGTASNNEVTVRALAFIIAGHELHHRRILEEKYLPAIPRA